MFVTTDAIQKSHMGPYINKISSLLGKKPFNLNEDSILNNDIFNVNERLYNDYMEAYIKKHDSKQSYFWQIVTDYLNTTGEVFFMQLDKQVYIET